MKRLTIATLAAALLASPIAVAPVAAQDWQHDRDHRDNDHRGNDNRSGYGDRGNNRNYGWNGDRNGQWDPKDHYRDGKYRERRLGRNDRVYRGGDGRYYCRRNDGTTGLVIGAIGGGLLGNAIGGDTLGTLLGAGGGALLGRSVDRGNVRCR
jgi:Ni/Co efflux regulator RcnB